MTGDLNQYDRWPMEDPVKEIPAIDVHAHYGRYDWGPSSGLQNRFMSADPATVLARARAANIEYTVVSPLLGLLPRGKADAAAGNDEAAEVVDRTTELLQWVVVDPHNPRTFEQARRRLRLPWCAGIKIHPEEHDYPIAEYGRVLFDMAAEFNAVVMTHSGCPNSLPHDFLPFADAAPNVTLILAHLGHSADDLGCDLQVRAIQAARHGNVFADTSSVRSIWPGLIEWAVGEVGAEKILFGTDSPLHFAPSMRARIDHAALPDDEKRMILRDNARRLLRLNRNPHRPPNRDSSNLLPKDDSHDAN